jgi:hypothetical protein
MEFFFIIFPLICGILSYGLMRKPPWMWYVGWVFLYLCSGFFCTMFYGVMFESQTGAELISSLVYFVGGLVLWMPCTLWWIKLRPAFHRKAIRKKPKEYPANP